jgi:acyl-CoA thioesterase-2
VVDEGLQGMQHDETRMPAVPPPHELKSIDELVAPQDRSQRFRFWDNLDARPIEWMPWPERTPGPPVWREWYRFRPRATFDDPFTDAARSVLLIDTMSWPAACQPYVPDSGYVAPSLDVTVQFHRAAPDAEWLLCAAGAPIAEHGLIRAEARIWSPDGRLLATGGGQLLCRPRPAQAGPEGRLRRPKPAPASSVLVRRDGAGRQTDGCRSEPSSTTAAADSLSVARTLER